MAKALNKLVDELMATNHKQDLRALKREKEMYASWRDSKLMCIDHARKCKKLGLGRLQLRWQLEAAKYDRWAKESKARIRQIGRYIYK